MLNLPEWKRSLFIMWFAQLTGMGAITGVLAFMPLYLPELGVTSLHEIEIWSGVLLAVASLFSAIAGPYWGALADQRGRKLVVEKVMLAFFVFIFAMAFVTNVYQLLALRILQGIFGGFTAGALALVTSITPPEELNYTLGVYQTAMIAGSAFGPIFGGLVADHLGFRQAFMAFGLLCLISLVVIHFAVRERFTPQPATAKTSVPRQIRNIVSIPGLSGMLFLQFLIQFSIQVIAPVLPLYVQTMVHEPAYIASICGTIIAAGGVTSAVASASMGTIAKRLSHRTILFTSSAFGAIFFAAQALAGSVLALGIMRGVSGFFIGSMLPTVNAIITLLIPPEKRGVAYAVSATAALLGNVLGPMTGGILPQYFGFQSVFWLTAALFALVAAWAALFIKNPKPDPV